MVDFQWISSHFASFVNNCPLHRFSQVLFAAICLSCMPISPASALPALPPIPVHCICLCALVYESFGSMPPSFLCAGRKEKGITTSECALVYESSGSMPPSFLCAGRKEKGITTSECALVYESSGSMPPSFLCAGRKEKGITTSECALVYESSGSMPPSFLCAGRKEKGITTSDKLKQSLLKKKSPKVFLLLMACASLFCYTPTTLCTCSHIIHPHLVDFSL